MLNAPVGKNGLTFEMFCKRTVCIENVHKFSMRTVYIIVSKRTVCIENVYIVNIVLFEEKICMCTVCIENMGSVPSEDMQTSPPLPS